MAAVSAATSAVTTADARARVPATATTDVIATERGVELSTSHLLFSNVLSRQPLFNVMRLGCCCGVSLFSGLSWQALFSAPRLSCCWLRRFTVQWYVVAGAVQCVAAELGGWVLSVLADAA